MNSVVLPTHTPALFEEAVRRAAALLRAGQLVALPTETVYGLAANAWDPAAVARIYEVKGRPAGNPIIVHVAGLELARQCVSSWPPAAAKLAAAFWPGPLTLVLPRSARIPDIVTAGGATVGVRWPAHPFIQAVIRACGFPLAAPSANPASRLSPTCAEHVRKYFDGKIPLIVDGGPARVGLESSVLDVTTSPPRLLRPGMVSMESLLAALGKGGLQTAAPEPPAGAETIARSPGLPPKHYSPKAKLVVLSWRDDADLRRQTGALGFPAGKIHILARGRVPACGDFGRVAALPSDADAFARVLYAELHQCDEAGAGLIVVEAPPPQEPWRAVADRLARAARES
jgi:L-threonylcarbamoyladenylate synthase